MGLLFDQSKLGRAASGDVLKIAQSALSLKDTIHAKLRRGGVEVAAHMPVARVFLATDVHQHEILLGLFDSKGQEQRFSLPLEIAKPLAERLPAKVAEIEAAIPTRTRQ
jgi:hypothetical protein